jgi:hypothetical protein
MDSYIHDDKFETKIDCLWIGQLGFHRRAHGDVNYCYVKWMSISKFQFDHGLVSPISRLLVVS